MSALKHAMKNKGLKSSAERLDDLCLEALQRFPKDYAAARDFVFDNLDGDTARVAFEPYKDSALGPRLRAQAKRSGLAEGDNHGALAASAPRRPAKKPRGGAAIAGIADVVNRSILDWRIGGLRLGDYTKADCRAAAPTLRGQALLLDWCERNMAAEGVPVREQLEPVEVERFWKSINETGDTR